jgi:hypothetical protein
MAPPVAEVGRVLGADEAGEISGPEAHRDKVHGGVGEINVKNR